MTKIFPGWDDIGAFHGKLTEGERKIASYLSSNFSDDWEIYVQPFLNGSRPDIIILNPKKGIMIIEVKDWYLEKYFFRNEKKSSLRSDLLEHIKLYFIYNQKRYQ